MMRKWTPLLIAIIIGLTLAVIATKPPKPQAADIPADQFSSARAMQDIRIIAAEPHPTGSVENAKVRTYLENRMTELGMAVSVSESQLGERPLTRLNRWSGENKTEQSIFNVIGILPGKDSTKPALLLMAHHDTVWGSPGAADDTVGIASIFEIVRALKEAGPAQRDLVVLLTDGEELGLSGAQYFFNKHPLRDNIGAVINFEARGGGGTANMFQTSAANGNVAGLYARSVKEPSTSSLSTFVYSVLPNDTDLTPALEKDYVAYNIANIGRAGYYHSPKIDAEALDEGTVQHMGSQGLDLTRALLSADAFPTQKQDATFFDFFGLFTIIYAAFWGWVFLAVAALCYALSVSGKMRGTEIVGGLIRMMGLLILGGLVLYGLNKLSGNGSTDNYYDRLAAIPKLNWVAGFLCVAVFFAFFGRKTLTENGRLGAAIPFLILGVIGQALAPTATYFITLPLLLCAIASCLLARWPDRPFGPVLATAFGAVIIGYMLGLGHLLMLGVGPDMLAVAILPAALGVMAALPLYPGLSNRLAYTLAGIGLIGSIGTALWVRLDPIASTVPLY